MSTEQPVNLSRRAVLCAIAAMTVSGFDSAAAATGVKILANGKVEIVLKGNPALKKVGGVLRVDDVNGSSFAVVRTSAKANGYLAINLSCTHLGILVRQSGSKWVCPAHGSEFTLSGTNSVGPATTPLQTLPIKASAKTLTIG